MLPLTFDTAQDFKEAFANPTDELFDAIHDAIQTALEEGVDSAHIFTLYIGSTEDTYEIKLPKSIWIETIESLMEQCSSSDRSDDHTDRLIDFHLLKKQVDGLE